MTFFIGEEVMENNTKQHKGKKWLKFRHVYGFLLFLLTLALAGHAFDLLVLTPRREVGIILGYRMENIQALEEAWMRETETFGGTLPHVDDVTIFWNTGPVVYVSVRVDPGTSLNDARYVAREVIEFFIEASHEVARQYDIQVVVSYGDVAEQRAANHTAVAQHVHDYHHQLVEAILAHAEQYPNEFNIHRASENLSAFAYSITVAVGESGLEEMRARLNGLVAVDLAIGNEMPVYAGERQVPPSNISEFPNWGTWSNERSSISWNP